MNVSFIFSLRFFFILDELGNVNILKKPQRPRARGPDPVQASSQQSRQNKSIFASAENIQSLDRLVHGAIMTFQMQNFARILHFSVPISRSFHQCQSLNQIQLLTRLRVVDNSAIGKEAMLEGRPPKCIHVYNKTGIGTIGMNSMFHSCLPPINV